MAALTPLSSTTLEDALVEISYKLQAAENDTVKNASGADNVQVTMGANGSVNISASLPSVVTIDAQGHPVINAVEYLT
jgi:hypothetical protein